MCDEKRLISKIEKLCKDGYTDALLYLCRNYGDAAIEGYKRGYRKAFWTWLGVASVVTAGCAGIVAVVVTHHSRKT